MQGRIVIGSLPRLRGRVREGATAGGQTGDGSQKTLTVPERHTKLLEVNLRQLRQDIGVDITRAKERLILSEAEIPEPTPDIYVRAPRAPNGSSFG
jgi:hypothetical protein